MSFDIANGPRLDADFADRVLARADAVAARRRRVRFVLSGVVALSFVSVAALSLVMMPATRQPPAPKAGIFADAAGATETDEADALSDFFPDATSVAQFAADYSTATDGQGTPVISDEDASS